MGSEASQPDAIDTSLEPIDTGAYCIRNVSIQSCEAVKSIFYTQLTQVIKHAFRPTDILYCIAQKQPGLGSHICVVVKSILPQRTVPHYAISALQCN